MPKTPELERTTRPSILIVADDVKLRAALTDQLQPSCEVRTAAAGDEAVALLGAVRFDAFVADMVNAAERGSIASLLSRLAGPEAKARLSALSNRAALGTMTAALIHDLAGMIQGIQYGLAEIDFMLEGDVAIEPAELREALSPVTDMSNRIVNLFTATSQKLRSTDSVDEPCSIPRVLEHARILCDAYVRRRARLQIAPAPEIEIEANEARILRVLTSLVRNAADASPQGGTIDVSVNQIGDHIEICVVNDGPGVPPKIESSMFEPFVSDKPIDAGCGLGLAISAQIVRDYGGTVDYTRAAGRGARFVVSLPIRRAGADREPDESRRSAA